MLPLYQITVHCNMISYVQISFSSILTNRLLPYPVTQYNNETEDRTNDLNTLATLIAGWYIIYSCCVQLKKNR